MATTTTTPSTVPASTGTTTATGSGTGTTRKAPDYSLDDPELVSYCEKNERELRLKRWSSDVGECQGRTEGPREGRTELSTARTNELILLTGGHSMGPRPSPPLQVPLPIRLHPTRRRHPNPLVPLLNRRHPQRPLLHRRRPTRLDVRGQLAVGDGQERGLPTIRKVVATCRTGVRRRG
jgi:hypothetical protein